MIELRSNLDNLRTPPLIFTHSQMSKFGLILDFKALQFQDETKYLTLKQVLAASMRDICPP